MARDNGFEMEGVVIDCLPGSKFKVELDEMKGTVVTATLAGKIRINNIRILKGDKVTVEMSPYDTTKGRIVWRTK